MKIKKNLARITLAGLVPLVMLGCGGNKNPQENVQVYASKGFKFFNLPGGVNFEYKGLKFFDNGFDGTLDLVVGYNDLKKESFSLNKDSPGFEEYIPLYLEAREKATKME